MKVLNTDIELVCENGLNSGNALSKGLTMHNDMPALVFLHLMAKILLIVQRKKWHALTNCKKSLPRNGRWPEVLGGNSMDLSCPPNTLGNL